VLDALTGAGAEGSGAAALADRLTSGGLAHPRPDPVQDARALVTVVVPVHDNTDGLARCLAALGDGPPVIVVDDCSAAGPDIAVVCERFGAKLLRRTVNGGPGAARNDGLREVRSPFVAFVDSDCAPPVGWLDALLPYLTDPRVAGVAPRVLPAVRGSRPSLLDRFLAARSPLDMGPDEGAVRPLTPVSYVPTAALLVRRSAIEDGFDEQLRYGEDVDLVWRLHDRGWQVRYVPSVVVRHEEPVSWPAALRRRHRYGTAAGPLDRRHPGRLAPAVLSPLQAAAAVLALAGRPLAGATLTGAMTGWLAGRLRHLGVPTRTAVPMAAAALGGALTSAGRLIGQLALPVALLPVLRRRSWLLIALPAAASWWQRRPALDPVRWAVACLVDDAAYGTGVWLGSIRARTAGPLLPRVTSGYAGRA
jgi:mycofactocin system glycosyltransferase